MHASTPQLFGDAGLPHNYPSSGFQSVPPYPGLYFKKTRTIRTCAPIPPTTIASLHTMVLCALTIPNLGSLTFRFLLFIVPNIKEKMPSKQASKTPLFRNKKGQRVGIQMKQLFHSVIIRAPEHFWIANRHFIQQRYS